MRATAKDYADIYKMFSTPISTRFDCGRFCAPLNGGEPVCCTTTHAVPVATRAEWQLLRSRTDLWRRYRPSDAPGREIVAELDRSCVAIECKGAAFCERHNRTLACRAFPFFPYFTRQKELIGLTYYWRFEDSCWVISNLWRAQKAFISQLLAAYTHLFSRDPQEQQAFVDESASMRRVFSRWRRPILLLGPTGQLLKVPPHSNGRVIKGSPADLKGLRAHGPYRSQTTYQRTIAQSGGNPKTAPLLPIPPRL